MGGSGLSRLPSSGGHHVGDWNRGVSESSELSGRGHILKGELAEFMRKWKEKS